MYVEVLGAGEDIDTAYLEMTTGPLCIHSIEVIHPVFCNGSNTPLGNMGAVL
jgi:hypothetical protein